MVVARTSKRKKSGLHIYSIRFDNDVYRWLQQQAVRNERSTSSLIRLILREYKEKVELER